MLRRLREVSPRLAARIRAGELGRYVDDPAADGFEGCRQPGLPWQHGSRMGLRRRCIFCRRGEDLLLYGPAAACLKCVEEMGRLEETTTAKKGRIVTDGE